MMPPRRAAVRVTAWQAIAAFCFGVVFVVTLLILAIVLPEPTPFQYNVFRIVLALACAGVATVVPGILHVRVGKVVTAGGAMAVFAIVYFYSPAQLVAKPTVKGDVTIYDPPGRTQKSEGALREPEESRSQIPPVIPPPATSAPATPRSKSAPDVYLSDTGGGDPGSEPGVTLASRSAPGPKGRVTTRDRLVRGDPALVVSYEYQAVGSDAIRVTAILPYAVTFMRGGPISDINPQISWEWPRLSVQFSNNTSQVIALNQLIFQVHASRIDDRSLLIITEHPYNEIEFVNQGWGTAHNTTLDFSIRDEQACREGRPIAQGDRGFGLGAIDDRARFDVRPFVPSELIPAEREKTAFVCVEGFITFQNPVGVVKKVGFRTKVQISGPAAGPAVWPGEDYYVYLPAGRSGYTRHVPISYELPPGRAEHFLIRIGTDKSAEFDFALSARAVDGLTIPLKRISLSLIVPKQDARSLNARYRE